MGRRKRVDIVATTATRFSHIARASADDAAPRLPHSAKIRCVACKGIVAVGRASLIERGRWACRKCVAEKERAR